MNSLTICQSVREAEVWRCSAVESPYTWTVNRDPGLHFSVRLKNSSQAANVFESGKMSSSKTTTTPCKACVSTEQSGFILKSSDQLTTNSGLNAIFLTLCTGSKA